MPQSITVPASIDSSAKLQTLINNTGNTPAKFIFSPDQEIRIESRIRVFNNTEWDGNGCTFSLMENAPVSIFGEQTPLIAPRYPRAAENLIFHDIVFDGNRDNQRKVEAVTDGKPWGKGYHNFFLLGDLSNVAPGNSKNFTFYNLGFYNNLGDGIRVEGGTDISIHDIKGKRGGHDIICLASTKGGEVSNVEADLAVNAAVRTRSSWDIKIHDCSITGTNIAYCPGIQIQATSNSSGNIEIYNNDIRNVWGPGIQVVGNVKGNGTVSIHHNLFEGCGGMPAATGTPYVGGIIFDGFPVDIRKNTFVDCLGYGLAAGDYNIVSPYSFIGTISRNIVVGTKKAMKPGTASGSGIANLIKSRYSLDCSENNVWGNLTNLFNVSNVGGLSVDPLFSEDYHLQADSPCRFEGYQLGRYDDDEDISDTSETPAFIELACTEEEFQMIKNTLTDRQLFWRSE